MFTPIRVFIHKMFSMVGNRIIIKFLIIDSSFHIPSRGGLLSVGKEIPWEKLLSLHLGIVLHC